MWKIWDDTSKSNWAFDGRNCGRHKQKSIEKVDRFSVQWNNRFHIGNQFDRLPQFLNWEIVEFYLYLFVLTAASCHFNHKAREVNIGHRIWFVSFDLFNQRIFIDPFNAFDFIIWHTSILIIHLLCSWIESERNVDGNATQRSAPKWNWHQYFHFFFLLQQFSKYKFV